MEGGGERERRGGESVRVKGGGSVCEREDTERGGRGKGERERERRDKRRVKMVGGRKRGRLNTQRVGRRLKNNREGQWGEEETTHSQ